MTSRDLVRVTGQILHLGHQEGPMIRWYRKTWTVLMRILEMESIWIFPHWLIMERSRDWPDLRSRSYKNWDERFVGTDEVMQSGKFHIYPSKTVSMARPQTFLVVVSLDLTWWPDLRWPGVNICTKCAYLMSKQLCQIWRRYVTLSAKNMRGGSIWPPTRAKVKQTSHKHSSEPGINTILFNFLRKKMSDVHRKTSLDPPLAVGTRSTPTVAFLNPHK